MKQNFLRFSVVKPLVMSLFFALFVFAANTSFAQSTAQINKAISGELTTMKQSFSQPGMSAELTTPAAAQAQAKIAIKYSFYSESLDAIGKLGNTTAGINQVYNSFTAGSGSRDISAVDAAKADLIALLNSL